MLTNASFVKGLVIHATDGELGAVDQFFFDDETWAIRYLVVATDGWLGGRKVLISPMSIIRTDWQANRLEVALNRNQVEKSPDIDTHQPVSRQHEVNLLGYYGYPYYWGGPYLWGPAFYPVGIPVAATRTESTETGSADSHLRSSKAVHGYRIETTDGEIGHLDGYVIDDETWSIRYIEVATRNWLPGKKVLLSPEWIDRVSWLDQTLSVGLSTDAIKDAPEYVMSRPLTREYENKLYVHYGQAPYWLHGAQPKSTMLTSV
jgi:hypothetical protein